MLLILFSSFSFSYLEPEYNGFGKSFKKAIKKVTKPVTKPVEKVTKKVVKETGKFIEKKSTSTSTNPIKISSLIKKINQQEYNSKDPISLASQISSKFGIDLNQINNFLKSSKFTTTSKKSFNKFQMDILNDKRYRTAKYLSNLISSKSNSDGSITIKIQEAVSTCQIFAEIVEKTKKKQLGGISSSSKSSSKWRPLINTELNQIFNTVQQNIQQMKK